MKFVFLLLCAVVGFILVVFIKDPSFKPSYLFDKGYYTDVYWGLIIPPYDRDKLKPLIIDKAIEVTGDDSLQEEKFHILISNHLYTIDNRFVSGTVTWNDHMHPYKWLAARREEQWVVVHLDTLRPYCSDLTEYKMPQEFSNCIED